ncbi:class I SAM-dependent methyltransferase [Teredinibacter waterburyi]|uniref:class I SAM-dependent methyltransferase n=1 Tax=Teredinibacter waterburyi TaxID=1500538 RepID=UPI00165FED66|nr:methyltransferase [Teredinibacter waterburyi]
MYSHARSICGIKVLKNKSPILKEHIKNTEAPSLYGHQVWKSSFLLMEYLSENPLVDNQRVMDVGCGWGLLGIFCAKHFASDALLVDADHRVFPYVGFHQDLNEVSVQTSHTSFGDLAHKDFAEQDVVVGADICFWPELTTQLRSMFVRALEAGVKRIILADPGRKTFHQLADFFSTHYNATVVQRESRGRTKSMGYLLLIDGQGSEALKSDDLESPNFCSAISLLEAV